MRPPREGHSRRWLLISRFSAWGSLSAMIFSQTIENKRVIARLIHDIPQYVPQLNCSRRAKRLRSRPLSAVLRSVSR